MIQMRHDYSFRNRDFMSTPPLSPTPNADAEAICRPDETWEIIIPETNSRLVRYFSTDLYRFMAEAFGICLRIRRVKNIQEFLASPEHKIILAEEIHVTDSPLTSEQPGAYYITVSEQSVIIIGKTERGTAQGAYYMEDMMRLRGECALAQENQEHAPLFSPRMTHSGIEHDIYTDNYLEALAHSGMDAIIVYSAHHECNTHGFHDPGGYRTSLTRGYCDFNNLVWRAAGYGLDVYIYSLYLTDMHPDDPGAAEYYDASFGQLFKNCPGLKGIIFVGESFEFPSKDPHTSGCRLLLKKPGETRRSPGWYPCEDYPQFVTLVKDSIHRYAPQADVIFWTYNWGYVDQKARLALIEKLPKDITLLVTFEMWEIFKDENGQDYRIDDYSVCFPGPSNVFMDEAAKAKEMGLRLYTMCNTGGRTWDVGCAPYIPATDQWQQRYENLCQAKEDYGLSGLMESHHYGWYPSFLTLFSKNAFTSNRIPNSEMLQRIAARDWGTQAEKALQAWKHFSQGMSYMVASDVDQYGPYRSGPTYPLTFSQTMEDLQIPSVPWARCPGFAIWTPIYKTERIAARPANAILRYNHVCRLTEEFRMGCDLLDEAREILGDVSGSELSSQAAVARFMYCTYVTASHVMEWTIAKFLLMSLKNQETHDFDDALYETIHMETRTMEALAERMREIAAKETDNVSMALTCYEEDSIIGFECTMEYVFNREFADWKNAETKKSLAQLEAYLKES